MHRPDDNYGFVATQTISVGTANAFQPGDPVPDSTVDEYPDWLEDGLVVAREDWEDRPEEEEPRAQVRGEMPPNLRDKIVAVQEPKTPTSKAPTSTKSKLAPKEETSS